jgi:flagellin-specific chaperone FliS
VITILAIFENKLKKLYLIILRKIKIGNFSKNGHILCNENKTIKNLMNAFKNSL